MNRKCIYAWILFYTKHIELVMLKLVTSDIAHIELVCEPTVEISQHDILLNYVVTLKTSITWLENVLNDWDGLTEKSEPVY